MNDHLDIPNFKPRPVARKELAEPEPQETRSDKIVAYTLVIAVGLAFFLAFFG